MVMQDRISKAYHYGTAKDLEELQIQILNERKKVGDFIDMFLDKYDNIMTLAPIDDPLWKLFRAKHSAYGDLERHLKAINYFLSKNV